jgi:hypothetical protein
LGYLDFKSNGFGPVVENETNLMRQIEITLQNECQVDPIYLDRMRKTLPLRDGENCARTVAAIEKRYPAHLKAIDPQLPISDVKKSSRVLATNFKSPRLGVRLAIITPLVKILGNENDLKKLKDNPARFFAKLRNPIYRNVGKILFAKGH